MPWGLGRISIFHPELVGTFCISYEMKPAKNTPRRMVLEKFLKGDRKEECEKSKGSYR